jgi:hypothetical protein
MLWLILILWRALGIKTQMEMLRCIVVKETLDVLIYIIAIGETCDSSCSKSTHFNCVLRYVLSGSRQVLSLAAMCLTGHLNY